MRLLDTTKLFNIANILSAKKSVLLTGCPFRTSNRTSYKGHPTDVVMHVAITVLYRMKLTTQIWIGKINHELKTKLRTRHTINFTAQESPIT